MPRELLMDSLLTKTKYVMGPEGGGLLSLEEACSRYTLSIDEFLVWQRSIDRHGFAGLRTTRTQQYRRK
jgi:Protein of unknown function (DUF1153)